MIVKLSLSNCIKQMIDGQAGFCVILAVAFRDVDCCDPSFLRINFTVRDQ